MIKKVLKYLLYIFIGIFILIVFLLVFSQTAAFRKIVKNQAEKIVSSSLNGDLFVGELEGNFYDNLTLRNSYILQNTDTLLKLSSLNLDFDLFELRNKIIEIDTIILDNPIVSIRQNPDSIWNFLELIPQKEKQKKKSEFPFKIDVSHLQIINGNIFSASHIELIPDALKNLNLTASGAYSSDELYTKLHEFRLDAENPKLQINQFSTYFKMNEKGLSVDSLILQTSGSNIFVDGNYGSLETFQASVKTNPVDKQEIALFVPSFKLACSPEVSLDVETQNDSTNARVNLKNGNETISLITNFHSFNKSIKDKTSRIPYFVSLAVKNLVPENWFQMKTTTALINGNIQLEGTHLFDFTLPIKVTANLNNSVYQNYTFNTLLLNGNYAHSSVNAELELGTIYGGANIQAKLYDFTVIPKYKLAVQTDSFLLSNLIPVIDETIITGEVTAEGTGFTNNQRKIQAEVLLRNSIVYSIQLDSANILANMDKMLINLDSLELWVKEGTALAHGSFDLEDKFLNAGATVNMHDSVSFLKEIVELPVGFDSLFTNAAIKGPVSDLAFIGNTHIQAGSGYSLNLQELNTNFSGKINPDSLFVRGDFNLIAPNVGSITADTINTTAEFFNNTVRADLHALRKDTFDIHLKTAVEIGDTLNIHIPFLDANTFFSHLYMNDTTQSIQINDNTFKINNLSVRDYNTPDFSLDIHGDLALNQTDNLQLELKNYNLAQINRFISIPDSVFGLISSNIELSGNKKNPGLSGSIEIKNPRYGNFSFSEFNSQLNFSDQTGTVEFSIPGLGNSVSGNVEVNMQAYLDSSGFVFEPPESFQAALTIDSVDIAQPESEKALQIEATGTLNVDMVASGTFENPQFNGFIRIDDGSFNDTKLGINYDEIDAKVEFEGNKINLDTFLIKQQDGYLTAEGELEFDSSMIKGNIISSSLIADASNFYVSQNRNYEIQIDANTFLKGDGSNPEFGGKIKVLRSNFYLPAILAQAGQVQAEEEAPLLVQALTNVVDTMVADTLEEIKEKVKQVQPSISKTLTGRLRVDIPRNTWIRSEDMNLELEGELDVVNTESFFELFGDISIRRGHYMLYGKKFNIAEGQVIFQGGIEVDPILNFKAVYTHRGPNKQKRDLELLVTDRLSEPTINFTMDGSYLSEYDALSILVFGKTSNEMDYEGQSTLVSSVSSNMVAQLLSNQLNKTLGSHLSFDMLEITSTGNWQSAAFVVGKYITNDLFVIYQRGFGEKDGDEITPEMITLEYEVNRILFLRLIGGNARTSGFDVILKFEPKRKDPFQSVKQEEN